VAVKIDHATGAGHWSISAPALRTQGQDSTARRGVVSSKTIASEVGPRKLSRPRIGASLAFRALSSLVGQRLGWVRWHGMSQDPGPSREAVISANVSEHAQIAIEYEARTRELATSPALWDHWYFDHLRTAIHELTESEHGRSILALDALGGTGKTALFLQQHGVDVILNDVSPEMTDVYRRIAGELGLDARVELTPIESYLEESTTPPFSLITASSALHHLQNYEQVIQQFYDQLKPGGFLYTAWDPLPRRRVVRWLGKAEYYLKRMGDPSAALRGVRRRIGRRRVARAQPVVDHEFHKAIDDAALIDVAQRIGFVVRVHHRNAGGSLRITKPLWTRFHAYTSFALLLQRPYTA